MRILIVGAGCVGQVYGWFLQRGGADVDVYIRPKYVDEANQGYRLYERRRKFRDDTRFVPEGALTSPEEVGRAEYDVILLCISSTALRSGWLNDFAPHVGEALVVSLTPGIDDRQYLAQFVDEGQLATGLITQVSYPAPLEGEEVEEPGVAFWVPPLAPALFQGPEEALRPLVKALNKGGMSAKISGDVAHQAGVGSAALIPMVAALETVGWSFEKLKRDKDRRRLLDDAVEEAVSLVEARTGKRRPLPLSLLGPMTWRGILIAAPIATPFDLETYLKVHFTKVGDQTRLMLEQFIEGLKNSDQSATALEQLRREIGEHPEKSAS